MVYFTCQFYGITLCSLLLHQPLSPPLKPVFHKSVICIWISLINKEPITKSNQPPYISITAFSETNLFLGWISCKYQTPVGDPITNHECIKYFQLDVIMSPEVLNWDVIYINYFVQITGVCSCGSELHPLLPNNKLVCRNAATGLVSEFGVPNDRLQVYK